MKIKICGIKAFDSDDKGDVLIVGGLAILFGLSLIS